MQLTNTHPSQPHSNTPHKYSFSLFLYLPFPSTLSHFPSFSPSLYLSPFPSLSLSLPPIHLPSRTFSLAQCSPCERQYLHLARWYVGAAWGEGRGRGGSRREWREGTGRVGRGRNKMGGDVFILRCGAMYCVVLCLDSAVSYCIILYCTVNIQTNE